MEQTTDPGVASEMLRYFKIKHCRRKQCEELYTLMLFYLEFPVLIGSEVVPMYKILSTLIALTGANRDTVIAPPNYSEKVMHRALGKSLLMRI